MRQHTHGEKKYLLHMCDTTYLSHSHVWHGSFTCDVTHSIVVRAIFEKFVTCEYVVASISRLLKIMNLSFAEYLLFYRIFTLLIQLWLEPFLKNWPMSFGRNGLKNFRVKNFTNLWRISGFLVRVTLLIHVCLFFFRAIFGELAGFRMKWGGSLI